MADGFELQEELQHLQNISEYDIPNEHDPNSEDPLRLLEAAVEATAEASDAIRDPEVFDVYRSLLKYSEALPGNIMSKLLDSITSGFQSEFEATMRDIDSGDQDSYTARRIVLEMYAFLLQWFSMAAEKTRSTDEEGAASVAPVAQRGKRGRGGRGGGRGGSRAAASAARRVETWTWIDQIPSTLLLISKVLRIQSQRLWTTTPERDAFIGCLVKPAYHITENEQYMKVPDIKLGVYKVICLAVKHHGHSLAVQIHITQSLQFYEHLSEPMAECLHILAKEFDHPQLSEEILREIAGKAFNSQDNKGPRAFARFLTKFAELSPRLVLKQFSLLINQLDSEAYPMRIAIVEVIGFLIQELASPLGEAVDQGQSKRQVINLYGSLLERLMDISGYVRAKVLQVLTKLCDMKAKYPKQRLAITAAAIAALEDKVATVRKNAVTLLTRLILSHPYGLIHGGTLELSEWESKYKEVKEELARVEGGVGKAIQEDETQEGESQEGGEEEGKKKKKKQRKESTGDEMAVDGDSDGDEDEESEEDEGNGDTEREEDEDDEGDDDQMPVDGEERPKKKKRSTKLKPRKSQIDVAAVNDEQAALAALSNNELMALRLRKKYYSEALNFIRQIEGAMDMLQQLLGSTSKAEVLETMEFFRVAYEYRFESANAGIKKMIHLIWSKDNNSSTSEDGKELKGIRSRLLECYRSLYFEAVPDLDPKAQVNRIARNMIERTYDATLAELTSLEEMLRTMMEDNQVHPDVVSRLWKVYSAEKTIPKIQRRGTILIISMLALAKRTVLNGHIDTMLRIGLGLLGKNDLMLARYTCVALQRLNGSTKKVKGSLLDKTVRYSMDNPIFKKLQEIIEHPCRTKEWFGMAEQAINTIYALGEHPDILCNEIIKKFTLRVFSRSQSQSQSQPQEENAAPKEADPDAMDEDQPEPTQAPDEVMAQDSTQAQSGEKKIVGDAFELSQLLFIVGHVAIKQIVFLELVEREWKRQKDEKQAAEKQASRNDPRSKEGEELDQVVGNAEDEIGERIAAVRESELLYGPDSLLAVFGPMIVHICGSPHIFKNKTLRAAATLSFSKFLCVSSQFCENHHKLYFKILETSRDANIRSNIVIALGDVAVSFSTIIDENSNELYKGLSDGDLAVKKNTLMVLTHLILNGMIKVKGQLGEMAKCLEDPEPRIADLAKLFFTELSTKENAIYNNLPDVISHLSVGDHAVDEETFQSTMKYIFQFIDKEKQAENIVEKLCQRFRLTEDPRQWRDIAYCLSLLPFKSDRSIKKLIEGLQYYRDKLHEAVVYERFTEILAKARLNKSKDKPDSELNEFEQILSEHRKQGEEDQALQKRVEGKKAAARKRAARKAASKKKAPTQEEDD
ncbi:hypothetical protein AX16_008201 [Volvariella volvacea WC 439]|nr:hypothetical protein AX16_008201 [Volvariella volvacea WC 439]